MGLFSYAIMKRLHDHSKNLADLEENYLWHLEEIPEIVQVPASKPARMLGFKSSVLMYRYLARSRDLMHAFAHALDGNNGLGAALAARAHIETAGAIGYLVVKLKKFYKESSSFEDLDETVIDPLFLGARAFPRPSQMNSPILPQPIQVMHMVDAADDLLKALGVKRKKPMRRDYDNLSELCHPNFAGQVRNNRTSASEGRVYFSTEPTLFEHDLGILIPFVSPFSIRYFVDLLKELLREHETLPVIFRRK